MKWESRTPQLTEAAQEPSRDLLLAALLCRALLHCHRRGKHWSWRENRSGGLQSMQCNVLQIRSSSVLALCPAGGKEIVCRISFMLTSAVGRMGPGAFISHANVAERVCDLLWDPEKCGCNRARPACLLMKRTYCMQISFVCLRLIIALHLKIPELNAIHTAIPQEVQCSPHRYSPTEKEYLWVFFSVRRTDGAISSHLKIHFSKTPP